MDDPGTVLIASTGGPEWSATTEVLASRCGYRVLSGHSTAEIAARLTDAHVDLMVAEEGGSGGGPEILAGLRASHLEIIRVLVIKADSALTPQAITQAALYNRVLLWEAAA